MESLPVNFVFSPDWWNQRAGISFEEPFYLDVESRIANDVLMRRTLHELFGVGSARPQPRPVIGSRHIAGGFVMPALFGVPIRFSQNQAAWPVPMNLDRDTILKMRAPDVAERWPMKALLEQMDELERRFGSVTGDLNTGGLVNNAVEIRGNDFFADLKEDPELTDHLLSIIAETVVRLSQIVRRRSGSTSIAVNRSVASVDPAIHLTSNCSVSMISPALYEARILPLEKYMAKELEPFGVHHCGGNLQKYASQYGQLGVKFLDVGFGSDLAACSALFPGVFLNLRMSPVHMMEWTEQQIHGEVTEALRSCGRKEQVGVCCINMDARTPDANVRAMIRATADFAGAAPWAQ